MNHVSLQDALKHARFMANETKRVWFVNALASSGPMKYDVSERPITDTSFGASCIKRVEALNTYTNTPWGRALANCEKALNRPLSLGEMSDFLLDNFSMIANSDEAHEIRDRVLIAKQD